MNERFRFYRYSKKQKFAWHLDGKVSDSHGNETFLTFMMYLNDDFEGGCTDFIWEKVNPKQGTALIFLIGFVIKAHPSLPDLNMCFVRISFFSAEPSFRMMLGQFENMLSP